MDRNGGYVASEAGLFLALWLKKPLQIASVYPSSAHLADAMARFVDLSRPGPVLELGGGTGSLTRGLLRGGCPADRLIVLEREPPLAAVLRREFPGVDIIEDDATRLDESLAARGVGGLAAVVSSLPIKWFSSEMQWAVMRPCFDRLGPDGPFLQMTNGFSSPVAIDRLQVAGREVGRIWRNLPPAQIWSYARREDAPA